MALRLIFLQLPPPPPQYIYINCFNPPPQSQESGHVLDSRGDRRGLGPGPSAGGLSAGPLRWGGALRLRITAGLVGAAGHRSLGAGASGSLGGSGGKVLFGPRSILTRVFEWVVPSHSVRRFVCAFFWGLVVVSMKTLSRRIWQSAAYEGSWDPLGWGVLVGAFFLTPQFALPLFGCLPFGLRIFCICTFW